MRRSPATMITMRRKIWDIPTTSRRVSGAMVATSTEEPFNNC